MIVKLKPAVKSYLWGGTKLKKEWGKISDGETISECWELSFNPCAPSLIDGGRYAGQPLYKVATRADWGANCNGFGEFPVLNKLIDAALPLSVQVHPSDGYALANEGQYGKTEMWHILSAEEGAYLYLGFNRDMTPGQFGGAIADGTITEYLNKVYVKAGETYFIPSGTVHAINAGITLFEIQQNSTLTYRVYDYDRTDADGNKRELHIRKAREVADLSAYRPTDCASGALLGKCKYFSAYLYHGDRIIGMKNSFVSVTVTDGVFIAGKLTLRKGETMFVSAGESVRMSGSGSYILTCVG